MFRILIPRRFASKLPPNSSSKDLKLSPNRFVKPESGLKRQKIPEVIPDKYHTEWLESDSRVKQLMVRKFEDMKEKQEKKDRHEKDSITVAFFTLNQRIQIFNMVKKGRMDYNVSYFYCT